MIKRLGIIRSIRWRRLAALLALLCLAAITPLMTPSLADETGAFAAVYAGYMGYVEETPDGEEKSGAINEPILPKTEELPVDCRHAPRHDRRLLKPNDHQVSNVMRKSAIALHQRFIPATPQKTKPSVKKHMLRALINRDALRALLRANSQLPIVEPWLGLHHALDAPDKI
ncbi:MAG: hypothetical protein LBB86_00185 [Oscillospiraceae bacterium]|jgi:hypothetical protein|nr:hypothetical protein [Oscillospiraceae bacterium]